ncbi:MAG: hypothetical protein KC619_31660, partial [Myxococcales bacterium]|nr:hypothetical protein [Myxococcales bacterium]
MSDEGDRAELPRGGAADGAKLMVAAIGLGALALGGWLLHDFLTGEALLPEAEEALPELPEPGEPQERPMVSTGEGYGWTWVNPQPRWMPTWYAVDVADDGARAAIVGHRGAAVRYEESAIVVWPTGTEASLRGVAWVAAREAIAVGDDGTILRLGPGGATPMEGGEATLRAIVATAEGQALAVGDEGTILRIGDGVRPLVSSTDAHLLGAFARGATVFAVGEGTILRIEGDAVAAEASPVTSTLRAVGGCMRGSVYAVGDRGVVLRRHADGRWTRLATQVNDMFTGVSCDHGRVAAVSAQGRVLLVSGDRVLTLPSGFDGPWHAVDGGADGPSWVVGAGGRLATIEADHVRTRTAGPAVPIRAMGAIGGALVAVGEWGRIVRQSATGFAEAESPTESGLASLIPIGEGRLLAIGDFGALVDIRHDRATLLGTPTQSSLRDGVGTAEALLIVGSGGTVLRGPPDALAATVIADAGDLWAVSGTPAGAIAVGDGGLVVRLNETGFHRVDCDTQLTLRDVAHTPAGTFAVGDDGLILRIDGDDCAVDRRGGPALHAVGLGPEGRPIAAGDGGVVLERGDDGWTRVGVNVLGASIRTIWRRDRNV